MSKEINKDIEVGDYVRTKDKILKIDSFEKDKRNNGCVCFTTGEIYTLELLKKIITKHSKNIIDLIEVGDFVNGNRVVDKYLYAGEKPVLETVGIEYNAYCLSEGDSREILTKEQYMQNCYTVERS